jgi:thiol-disulfide isomerase/thioredoxin
VNPRNRTIAIVSAVVLVALVVFGIALLANSGGDDDSNDAAGEVLATDDVGGSATGEAAIAETRPVEVVGQPLPTYGSADPDPAIGVEAPVLEGESFDGTPITIGGSSDGPTLVVFLAHWCPHCNREVPELIALNDRGGIPADVSVIGVSTAVNPDYPNYPPSQWIVDKGWPWPAMADDETSTAIVAYGGDGFPFEVLLDEQGNVLSRKSGESTADQIQAWIETSVG